MVEHEPKAHTNPNVSWKQRIARERMWVNSLEALRNEVSTDTQEKVDDTIQFLNSHVYPAEPIIYETGEYWGISRKSGPETFGFVALFASDASLHPEFKRRIDDSQFQYNELARSVILPPKLLSPRWRGILMYHEVKHAQHHFLDNFRDVENANFIEEQSVYLDEHEIIRSIYGDRYVDFINQSASDISVMLVENTLSRKQLASMASNCMSETLDKTPYRFENSLRIGAIMLDLGFTALKSIGRNTPEDRALFNGAVQSDRRIETWDEPIENEYDKNS